jgi:hypothetical protein
VKNLSTRKASTFLDKDFFSQSVGLYYGNYISEEQVRYAGGNREVLIDVNLHFACDKLKLSYVRWDNVNEKNPQGENFLLWSQKFLMKNVPVIGGFYLQEKNGDRGLSTHPAS